MALNRRPDHVGEDHQALIPYKDWWVVPAKIAFDQTAWICDVVQVFGIHKSGSASRISKVRTEEQLVEVIATTTGAENDSLTDQNFYGGSKGVKRRFYKNWYKSNKKAFANYSKKFESVERKRDIQCQLERMKKYGTVIKVLAHTQVTNLLLIIREKEKGRRVLDGNLESFDVVVVTWTAVASRVSHHHFWQSCSVGECAINDV
ncbi:60S ribosomal protein L3-1 [Tanacetum coccineum]